MAREKLIALFLSLFLLTIAGCGTQRIGPAAFSQERGSLVVELRGFQNSLGEAIVSLFASAEGFPDRMPEAYGNIVVPIEGGRAGVVFKNVPFGPYAVSVLHDENRNGEMDKNWLGIPVEGYGVSRNVKGFFGPPDFEKARFLLSSPERELWIRLETAGSLKEEQRKERRKRQMGQPVG